MAEVKNTPKPARARKRSSRSKGKRKISKASETLKALWKTPEFRARMKARDENRSALMKAHPERFFRRGVPDGMRKVEADQKWSEARILADKVVQKMKDEGFLPQVAVPDTDDAKAEAALKEACVLALGPTEQRTKLGALRVVLEFTKKKPASSSEMTLNGAADWLNAVAADAAKSDGASE